MKKILIIAIGLILLSLSAIFVVNNGTHRINADETTSSINYEKEGRGPEHPGWMEQYLAMKGDENGEIPSDVLKNIWQEQQLRGASGNLLNIQEVGPSNVGGRTRAFMVDYSNENHLLAGGISGGLWRSLDKGATWAPVNDFNATLSITDITQNPFNPDIIYYSTGEPVGNSAGIPGFGIFKSTDRGLSFTQLASTTGSEFDYTYRIKCSLTDSHTVYVGTKYSGLYRSTDGGGVWEKVFFNASNSITDVEVFKDSSIIVGVRTKGIYRSPNGNTGTFTHLTNGLPSSSFSRVEMAYCDSVPGRIYAAYEHSSGDDIEGVYATSDTGNTWIKMTDPNSAGIKFNFPWYCLTLGVKPDNPDYVIIASVTPGYSVNGGATWTKIEHTHSDYHTIIFSPFNNNELYIGNDGGLYRYNTSTITNYAEDLNQGYNVTQFYAGAFFPTGDGSFGGTQDNGTQASVSGIPVFEHIFGGDGAFTQINQQNPEVAFVSYQYGRIHRTDEAMWSLNPYFYKIMSEMDNNNDNDIDDGAWFINPYEINQLDGDQLYFPTKKRVWRSTSGGYSWEAITGDLSNLIGQKPYAIGISNDLNPTVYIGGERNLFYRIDNAKTATTADVVNLNSSVPSTAFNSFIANITVHPQFDSVIYMALSNYSSSPRIFKVTDAKSSVPVWNAINGDLPAGLPVNWIEVHPHNDSFIVAATDLGLYTTIDGGATWVRESTIPNVSIHQIRLRKTDGRLFIYTHGRGIWSAQLPGIFTGIDNPIITSTNIQLYPNPVKDILQISSENSEIDKIEVYNLAGQLVTSRQSNNIDQLQLGELKNGAYAVRIWSKGEIIHSTLIMKQ